MTVIPDKYSCPIDHNGGSHLHQLWYFAFSGLVYPVEQNQFGFFPVRLHPYLSELFLEIVTFRQGPVHSQGILKFGPVFFITNVSPVLQQQITCTLQHFPLVDVLLHIILHPADFIELVIHQLHHMEMIEHM